MKKHLLFALLILFTLSCQNNAKQEKQQKTKVVENVRKSSLHSYKVTYKTLTDANGMQLKGTTMQWVDLKNNRFRMETESEIGISGNNQEMKSLVIGDGEWIWIVDLTSKMGYKSASETYEDNPFENIKDETTFEETIENESGKIVGTEQFLRKKCTVVEIPTLKGGDQSTMKAWYYKGIPLKMITPFYSMEAISFDENIEIPESELKVPENINFMEMPNM